jgi:hypothetical protein
LRTYEYHYIIALEELWAPHSIALEAYRYPYRIAFENL